MTRFSDYKMSLKIFENLCIHGLDKCSRLSKQTIEKNIKTTLLVLGKDVR